MKSLVLERARPDDGVLGDLVPLVDGVSGRQHRVCDPYLCPREARQRNHDQCNRAIAIAEL